MSHKETNKRWLGLASLLGGLAMTFTFAQDPAQAVTEKAAGTVGEFQSTAMPADKEALSTMGSENAGEYATAPKPEAAEATNSEAIGEFEIRR